MNSSKFSYFGRASVGNRRKLKRGLDCTISKDMHTTRTISLIVIFLTTSASASLFFPTFGQSSTTQNASNVCIYSVDPAKYSPKCFLCASSVYVSALPACLNGSTTMPNNITFSQANCLQSNCAINYPVKSAPTSLPLPQKYEILESLFKGGFKGKRSIPDDPISNQNLIVDSKQIATTDSYGDQEPNKILLQLDKINLSKAGQVRIIQFVETLASSDFAPQEPLDLEYEEY